MTKLIVGNWKMYPTLSDSLVLAHAVRTGLEEIRGVEVAVAPPTSWIVSVKEAWRHPLTHLHLAAQNIWAEDQGAFTGEVSAYLLKDLVKYAIVGHSERRGYIGETNDLIKQKIPAALKWGITPIVCVGEKEKMLRADGTIEQGEWKRVSTQLLSALESVPEAKRSQIIFAYEPVWAIGSQNPAKPEYALAIIERFKQLIADKYDHELASSLRFIYGGSVNGSNAADYLQYPEISGLLPGSASVKAKEFLEICRQAAKFA